MLLGMHQITFLVSGQNWAVPNNKKIAGYLVKWNRISGASLHAISRKQHTVTKQVPIVGYFCLVREVKET